MSNGIRWLQCCNSCHKVFQKVGCFPSTQCKKHVPLLSKRTHIPTRTLQRNLPGIIIVLSLGTSVSFQRFQVLLGPEIQPRAIWSFKAEAGVRISWLLQVSLGHQDFFLNRRRLSYFPPTDCFARHQWQLFWDQFHFPPGTAARQTHHGDQNRFVLLHWASWQNFEGRSGASGRLGSGRSRFSFFLIWKK